MKNLIKTNLMYVSIIAILASCAAPAEKPAALDLNALRPEIQAMEDAYSAAEKAKDAAAVAVYYSDDAISYSRNTEPTTGKAAITARIAERLAADTSGNYNVYKVVDLFGCEDMLVEIGSWDEYNPAGTCVNKGFYLSYFEKRDGKYQCVRDMNVTTMPEMHDDAKMEM